jgi:hypothetical protein
MKETASWNSISHKLNCPVRATAGMERMHPGSILVALAMSVKFHVTKIGN